MFSTNEPYLSSIDFGMESDTNSLMHYMDPLTPPKSPVGYDELFPTLCDSIWELDSFPPLPEDFDDITIKTEPVSPKPLVRDTEICEESYDAFIKKEEEPDPSPSSPSTSSVASSMDMDLDQMYTGNTITPISVSVKEACEYATRYSIPHDDLHEYMNSDSLSCSDESEDFEDSDVDIETIIPTSSIWNKEIDNLYKNSKPSTSGTCGTKRKAEDSGQASPNKRRGRGRPKGTVNKGTKSAGRAFQDPEKRREHNMNERHRRQLLSNDFLKMVDLIPKIEPVTKKGPSKIAILRSATKYIEEIQDEAMALETEIESLQERKAMLQERKRFLLRR